MRFRRKEVVITGVGVVSPCGESVDSFFRGILCASPSLSPIESFDAKDWSCTMAAEVRDFDPRAHVKKKKKLKLMGNNITYSVAASNEAFAQAGLTEGGVEPEALGVTLGARTRVSDFSELEASVLGSLDSNGEFSVELYAAEGQRHVYPLSMIKDLPNMAAAQLSIIFSALGPSNTITDGRPSGIQAIGEALRTIQRGAADVMICGGTDSWVNPLDVVHLSSLGIMAPAQSGNIVSRPFDGRSQGVVPGEGSAIFVLESKEHALARGAKYLAHVLGFAEGFEPGWPAFDESGQPFGGTWQRALDDAGLGPQELGGVCLGGAGYGPWDRFEASLARMELADAAVPLWSSRGHLGFSGAASGAIDVACALKSLELDVLPPTAGCEELIDEANGLDFVIGAPRDCSVKSRLISSCSRMGVVSALVLTGGHS